MASTTLLLQSALSAAAASDDGGTIFSRHRVQHQPPAPILHLAAANRNIVLVLANRTVQRIDQQSNITTVDLSKSMPAGSKISGAFLDPSGVHLIITLKTSDTPDLAPDLLYLNRRSVKPKLSSKVKGHAVTSIGWNSLNTSESVTGPILMGTARGLVFETEFDWGEERLFSSSLENYWRQVLDVGRGQHMPITGLEFHQVPQSRKYFVLVTTPTRLYQFQGQVGGSDERPLLAAVFSQYANAPDKFLELPSSLRTSTLSFFYLPKERGKIASRWPLFPAAFGWLTSPGIYTGRIDPLYGAGDTVTVDCQLVQFPHQGLIGVPNESIPKAFLLTQFHVLLAYETSVSGVCLLNQQVVFDSELDANAGKIRGMSQDPISGTLYVFYDYVVYRFKVDREDRNMWKVYLEQGDFERAQQFCLGDETKLEEVLSRKAQKLFDEGQFVESAMHFAKTKQSFEEIALKFMEIEEKTALLNYLKRKLEMLRTADKAQTTMIIVWLVEIYLSSMCRVQESDSDKYEQLRQEFLSLLQSPRIAECVGQNKSAIYDLIASHGDKVNLIHFASIMRDYDRMIRYHLQNSECEPVLAILREQRQPQLYYQHGPEMMQRAPTKFVDLLIEQGKRLAPTKLIPSLVVSSSKEQELQAIRFLEFVVYSCGNRETAIHNYLVALYVKHQSDKLEGYLSDPQNHQQDDSEETVYDIKYVLRLCQENNLKKECVMLYCLLGQLDEAVELALDIDLEQAKCCLGYARDEETKRKIWLRIAKHVVQRKNDIKQAMEYLQQCDNLVKIEDILPFFPDFVTIDHFKDAICESLHEYSKHIQELHTEMEESNRAADRIREEILDYKNRYIFVRASDTCSVCNGRLMTQAFHLFNCSHRFHTDCLIKEVAPTLSVARRKKLEEILSDLASSRGDGNAAGAGDDQQSLDSKSAKLSRRDHLRAELNDLIASDCVLCGDVIVRMVDRPFIEDEDFDRVMKEWL